MSEQSINVTFELVLGERTSRFSVEVPPKAIGANGNSGDDSAYRRTANFISDTLMSIHKTIGDTEANATPVSEGTIKNERDIKKRKRETASPEIKRERASPELLDAIPNRNLLRIHLHGCNDYVIFHLNRFTFLERALAKFANRNSIPSEMLRMYYEGDQVYGDMTADSVSSKPVMEK